MLNLKSKILFITILSLVLGFVNLDVSYANPRRDSLGTISISGQASNTVNNFNVFVDTIITFAIGSGVVVFMFMGVWASWQWLTAGADPKAVEAAKARLTSAVIGLILLAVTFGIFSIVRLLYPGELTQTTTPAPGTVGGSCPCSAAAGLVCRTTDMKCIPL